MPKIKIQELLLGRIIQRLSLGPGFEITKKILYTLFCNNSKALIKRPSYNAVCQQRVKKGSILGSLLFIIDVNDLHTINSCFTHILYADDTTLKASLSRPFWKFVTSHYSWEQFADDRNKVAVTMLQSKALHGPGFDSQTWPACCNSKPNTTRPTVTLRWPEPTPPAVPVVRPDPRYCRPESDPNRGHSPLLTCAIWGAQGTK